IPYGNFSEARPGGQTQYDISVTYPIDVTRKRRARTEVACRAKRVLEAQYQDAVRLQIDNLYTAFVDALSPRDTVRFARASVHGLEQLAQRMKELRAAGQRTEADVNVVRVQQSAAEIGLTGAIGTYRAAKRSLGVLLSIPQNELESLEVRGSLRVLDAP